MEKICGNKFHWSIFQKNFLLQKLFPLNLFSSFFDLANLKYFRINFNFFIKFSRFFSEANLKTEREISNPVNISDVTFPRKRNYTKERTSTGNKWSNNITAHYQSFGAYVIFPCTKTYLGAVNHLDSFIKNSLRVKYKSR